MLKLTVKPGEYLLIGNDIKLVFAGGSTNNLRILVDAPKSMNIARSSALERKLQETEPGNIVTHYKEPGISEKAQKKIAAILREERRKAQDQQTQQPSSRMRYP